MRKVKTGTVRALCALMIAVALLPGCRNRSESNATQTTAAAPAESVTTLLFVMLTDPETTTETTTQTTTTSTTQLITTTTKPSTTAAKTETTTATVVTSTTSAPSTAAPSALPSSASENAAYYSNEISQVQSLVNEHRSTYGLSPLTLDSQLTLAACIRAREMAKAGDLSHTRPNGKDCFSVFDEIDIKCSTCGENIAYGQSSPEDVFSAWRTSPGHNANMLNGSFEKIGVGVAADSQGRLYWVQLFAKDIQQQDS